MKKEKIIITGDTHADWISLNELIVKQSPNRLIVCGDFGYWPKISKFDINQLKPQNTIINWCDGNHEDHWTLKERKSNEIVKNVFYQPRGSVLQVNDKNILFFGGAYSIDKEMRRIGYDWFPDEIPSYADFNAVEDLNLKVDVVISHTCPHEFKIEEHPYIRGNGKIHDVTRTLLSFILNKFKPQLWYFGHWHIAMQGQYKDCNWYAMNMSNDPFWWTNFE